MWLEALPNCVSLLYQVLYDSVATVIDAVICRFELSMCFFWLNNTSYGKSV